MSLRRMLIGAMLVAESVVACSSGPPGSSGPPASSAPAASSGPSASVTPSAGITDEELLGLTGGVGERVQAGEPMPAVTAEEAERVVRARYRGDRPLIYNGPVRFGRADRRQVGWMVVLGLAPGQACNFHAGLLDRPLEGGIVVTPGDLSWEYTCG